MSSIIPVGIDLGTTFSVTSYINDSGRSQVIADGEGLDDENRSLTPSVVFFDQEGVRIGWPAWEAAWEQPEFAAHDVKRDMGLSQYRQSINGEEYPPEVIQGCLLRVLRKRIVAEVGSEYKAVITVPAYFDEARRKATADAGIMSGLPVLDILNEPTAAALAFGEQLGYLTPEGAPNESLRLLVYDLGGGTFDVTVIEFSAEGITTLATDGDYELGGIHWDQRLVDLAIDRFKARFPQTGSLNPQERLVVHRSVRELKHKLTDHPLATLELNLQGQMLKLPVTRNEFEELTADLVDRTVFTAKQALQAAGLLWKDIDRVLLVGGSSRMPAVRRAVKELTGLEPDTAVHPDEAVSRGAAIFARFLLGKQGIDSTAPKLNITEVNAHGLGIEGVNQETLRVENVILIPRNTRLPHVVKRTFATKTDNQRSVKIELLEGDSSLPGQCSRLAMAGIKNLPPGLPAGTKVQVSYSFQSNGRLAVDAQVECLGTPAKIELERTRGLEESRVNKWKSVVCRDGGYRDFEEAITSFLASDPLADPKQRSHGNENSKSTTDSRKQRTNLDPAIDEGAPLAAAEEIKRRVRDRNASAETSQSERTKITSLGDSEPAPKPVATPVARRRGRPKSHLIVNLIGHMLAPIVGLTLGYYGLVWARPDLNFLELDLPGLPTWAEQSETIPQSKPLE